MLKRIPYDVYLDKVYGAWLGKSIAGTIGAPYEGRKERFQYDYDPKAIETMLPNDDLDLQVLWLEVMERKGIRIDSDDLAEAFLNQCPYAPGEYAFFMKNYARGIHPPLSGSFNNRYYVNGMGCPIRSEIWALICPGNPALAAEYAAKDGVLDHEGDSVYAEQFLAAMEAAAFFESDLNELLRIGMPYLPEGTRIRRLVEDTIAWCRSESDWVKVRANIIRRYGHPDCTNLYQNIGFTLLSLLHGQGNFLDSTMIALNCGFDTDCSCATAGALLGIIQGASFLIDTYRFYDTSYKLSIHVTRKSNKLEDLAVDTCRIGLAVAAELNHNVTIENAPAFEPLPSRREPQLKFTVDYQGDPVIGLRETRTVLLQVENARGRRAEGKLSLDVPQGWLASWHEQRIRLDAGARMTLPLTLQLAEDISVVQETNLFKLQFAGTDGEESYTFGLNGAQIWKVYGPFWDNHVTIPPTELGEWYYGHIHADSEDAGTDLVRQFHLNTKAVDDVDPSRLTEPGEPILAEIKEDLFSVSDLIGFQGPCTVIMERRLYSPEERIVYLLMGHTDAYKLWINGELVSESNERDWWTGENKHVSGIRLRQGENRIRLQCIRRGKDAEYSIIFTEKGACMPHLYDFGSYVD
jgi:hypothetical protein